MEDEARSIMNITDINGHSSKLREGNIISELFKSGKQEFAPYFSSNIDDSKYSRVATFVSLEIIIILLDKIKNGQIWSLLDNGDSPLVICTFTKYW